MVSSGSSLLFSFFARGVFIATPSPSLLGLVVQTRLLPPPLPQPHAIPSLGNAHLTSLSLSDHRFYPSPSSQGHEWTGTIVDIHPSIVNFKIGDRVVSPFTTCCGSCFYCNKKLSSRCVKSQLFGSPGLDGGQAAFVKCPLAGESAPSFLPSFLLPPLTLSPSIDSTLILAPPDLPEELLVTMGDIMPTVRRVFSFLRRFDADFSLLLLRRVITRRRTL